MYEILHNNFLNKVTYFLYDLFDAFTQEEKVKTFTISIPSDVLLRSKLICEFIESEIEHILDVIGFKILEKHNGYTEDEVTPDTERIVYIVKK